MFNIKDIILAWVISVNPSKEQLELSEKRLEICLQCPSKSVFIKNKEWSATCKECGCPIRKKVFSQVYNDCPLLKWENIDKEYFNITDIKKNNSIL